MYFLGFGHQTLIVTMENRILAEFPREDALLAHILQFGALYVFGMSYSTDLQGNLSAEKTRNFYDFVTIFLWGIRPKYARKGSKKPKVKMIPKKVQELWANVSKP